MPAPLVTDPASSAHRVSEWVAVFTPATNPLYAPMMHSEPNPMYTEPFINSRPGRWRWKPGSNFSEGVLVDDPEMVLVHLVAPVDSLSA